MRKIWWGTAPLAVGLMLAAASQPYFSLYRPWAHTAEHVVEAGAPGHFDLPAEGAPDIRHQADIEVRGFQMVERGDPRIGIDAPDGFNTWVLLTKWSAPAESVLAGCDMWVTGTDGKKYPLTDAVFEGPGLVDDLRMTYRCVPPREEGPRLNQAEKTVEAGSARPEKWNKITPVAMPEGERPVKLHIAWGTPHYVTVVLPEPAEFIDVAESAPARSAPAAPASAASAAGE